MHFIQTLVKDRFHSGRLIARLTDRLRVFYTHELRSLAELFSAFSSARQPKGLHWQHELSGLSDTLCLERLNLPPPKHWLSVSSTPYRLAGTLSVSALLSCSAMSYALPTGYESVAGNVQFQQTADTLNVTTAAQKSIVNYQQFNVGQAETVNFNLPNSQAAILNRVIGPDPSQILGRINSNGQVFLTNPNGIIFGQGAQVNVGGLMASTLGISNPDFLAGQFKFAQEPGKGVAGIKNQGQITTGPGSFAILAGGTIENTGNINSPGGHIHLAAGKQLTVNVASNLVVELTIDEALQDTVQDAQATIQNSGTLSANAGGRVQIQAKLADNLYQRTVNNTGHIEAKGLGDLTGQVILQANTGEVNQAGTIETTNTSGEGGEITILGDSIRIAEGSLTDATGQTGGGEARIGGDYQGQGILPHAKDVVVESGAVIKANATQQGQGGKVILWSDESTWFGGAIEAKGGTISGNGGLVETSSKGRLGVWGQVDASATNGKGGEWLLDPSDVVLAQGSGNTIPGGGGTINPSTDTYQIDTNSIQAALNAGNSVTITTANGSGTQAGNITTSGSITINKTSGGDATLTLKADNNITLSNTTITSSSGKLHTVLWSDSDNSGAGAISLINTSITSNSGDIHLAGGLDDGSNGGVASDGRPDGYAWGTASLDDGVTLDNGDLSSGNGNITLRGQGRNDAATSNHQGLSITSGSSIQSASGNITLTGTGGSGTTNNYGVYLQDSNTLITSIEGNIAITGIANGSGVTNIGVLAKWGAQITSTGTGMNAASITINGTGGNGTGDNYGVGIFDSTIISSVTKPITITGQGNGATGPGAQNVGIFLYSSLVLSIGSASITITGTGAGVSEDIKIMQNSPIIGSSTMTGDIVLVADKVAFLDNINIQTTSDITIKPRTASTSIGIMGGVGTLGLTSTYLSYFNPGNKLIIGDSTTGTGTVTIGAWDLSGKTYGIEVYGGMVDFTGAVTWNQANSLLFHSRTGDLAIDQTFTKTGGAASNLTFKAANTITQTQNITSGSGALNTILWSDSDNSGAGAISLTSASITSNGGDIHLAGGLDDGANGGVASDGRPDGYAWGTAFQDDGVTLDNGDLSSAVGAILIRGHGANIGASNSLLGVSIYNASVLQSTSGIITIQGVGGNGNAGNAGVQLAAETTLITSSSGNINITGTGGNATGNGNVGIYTGAAYITSTGTGASAANISLIGTGGNGQRVNYGVYAKNIFTVDGDITIIGQGGSGSQDGQYGIYLLQTNIASTGVGSGAGKITIQGTGGSSSIESQGLNLWGANISSIDGDISLTGTAGTGVGNNNGVAIGGAETNNILSTGAGNITITGSSSNSYATATYYTTNIGGATATGNITFAGDNIMLWNGYIPSIQTAGSIIFKPLTSSSSIGVMGGAGALNISSTLLSGLSPGNKLIIGDSTAGTGTVTIGTWDLSGKTYGVEVYGGTVDFTGAVQWNQANSLLFHSRTGDLVINQNFSKTGGGESTLTLKAAGTISAASSRNISSSNGKLNTVFWSDADNDGQGAIDITYTAITTNNGNITMGGGIDPLLNRAKGTATSPNGIYLGYSTLSSGQGNITLRGEGVSTGAYGSRIQNNTTIQSTSGNISIEGMGGTGTSHNRGISLNTVSITTQTGNITLTGTGRGTTWQNYGISLDASSIISTGSSGPIGAITLNGTGSNTGNLDNKGIIITNSSNISTVAADIILLGQGGNSSDSNNIGIQVTSGSTISSTGVGADAGNITLTGTGGNGGTSSNYGILITASGIHFSTIATIDGDINITGTAGNGSADGNKGVYIQYGSTISSSGTGASAGNIIITGTGATGNPGCCHEGVQIQYGSTITSVDGDIDITGISASSSYGALMLDANSANITINSTGSGNISLTGNGVHNDFWFSNTGTAHNNVVGSLTMAGNITLTADRLYWSNLDIKTAGNIIVKPKTASTAIGINSGSFTLNLTAPYLNYLNPGNKLIIGDSAAGTGTVTIAGWDLTGKTYGVEVYGGTVDFTGAVTWNQANSLLFHSRTGDLAIDQTFTKTGGAASNLTFKAANTITQTQNITSGSGALNTILWSDSDNSGAGAISLTSASITSNGGDIHLAGGLDDGANGGVASDGRPDGYAWGMASLDDGITLNNGDLASGAGSILLRGHGRNDATSSNQYGLTIYNGSILQSVLGSINLSGTGGNGVNSNYGIQLNSNTTLITSSTGNITLVGQGGSASGSSNFGIDMGDSLISSTGTGINAANITLTGTGGTGTGGNYGILYKYISTIDGDITLNGTGGNGSGVGNYGLYSFAGSITSTGTGSNAGNITIIGIAGTGSSECQGVSFDGGQITAVDGNISISGTTSAPGNSFGLLFSGAWAPTNIYTTGQGDIELTGNSSGSRDIAFYGAPQAIHIGNALSSGNITIIGNDGYDYFSGLTITTGANIIVKPRTASAAINILGSGFTTDVLTLSSSWLASLNPANKLVIGDATAGSGIVTIGAWDLSGKTYGVEVYGGTVDFTGAVTWNQANNLLFHSRTGDLAIDQTFTKTGGGASTLTFKAANNVVQSQTVSSSSGALNTILWSDADNSGAGAITLANTSINSNGGNVILAGGLDTNADGTPDGYAWGTSAHGVWLSSSSITSGAGNVTLRGHGFNNAGSTTQMGIHLQNGNGIQTTSGNIFMTGIGGDGVHANIGVQISGASILVTSVSGNISITGQGGNASGNNNYGISIGGGASITSTGVGPTAGNIALNGTGGTGDLQNAGILLQSSILISTVDGDIVLNGTGGSGTNNYGHWGIQQMTGARIISTGTGVNAGNITLTGSTSSTDHGIYLLSDTTTIETIDGNIFLDAYGSSALRIQQADIISSGAGAITLQSQNTLSIDSATVQIGGPSSSGNITLVADNLGLSNTTIQTSGTITIKPRTASTTIGIMGGAGTLNLSSTLLGYLNPGTRLVIGDSAAGTGLVTIGAWNLTGKTYGVEVYGGTVDFTGAIQWNQANDLLFHSRTGDLNIDRTFTKTGGGTSTLTFKAADHVLMNSNITASSGALHTIFWSDTDNSGVGRVSLSGPVITNNGDIVAGGGLDDGGNGGIASDGRPDHYAWGKNGLSAGVVINGTLSSGSGNITIRGRGENLPGSNSNYGIQAVSCVIQTTSGNISMTGIGGNGAGFNYGIILQNSGMLISTQSGNITLTGTGGSGTTNNPNIGIYLYNGVQITSSGTGASVGSIQLTGTGGGGSTSGANNGIRVQESNTLISSVDANITLTGVGGNGLGANHGIWLLNDADIISTGSGNISLTGTRGDTDGNTHDIKASGATITVGGASASGNQVWTADYLSLANTDAQTSGSITLKPRTASTTIGVQGGTGTLNLSNSLLNQINPGNKLIIGDSSNGTGTVTIGAWNLTGKTYGVEVYGGTIDFTGAVQWNQANNLLFHSRTGDLAIDQIFTKSGGGSSTLTFQAENTITQTANITSSSGALNTILWSDSDNSGAGAIVLTNAAITSNGGNITLAGGADGNNDGIPDDFAWGTTTNRWGITLNNGDLSSATGSISLRGHGYDASGSSGLYGIRMYNGSIVQSTSGIINITGVSGSGLDSNIGIRIADTGTSITSSTGDISVTGTGNGSVTLNYGIYLENGASIVSTGSGINAAKINLTGTGGNGTYYNHGIIMETGGSRISSIDGNITLTGTGNGTATNNHGIFINGGGILESTGAGANAANITLTGTGAATAGANYGIRLVGVISTVDGDIAANGYALSGSGLAIMNGSQIFSFGVGANAGNIILSGTATQSGGGGIYGDTNIVISSIDGNIQLTGTGLGSGILMQNTSTISTTNGNISLTGICSNSYGILLRDTVSVLVNGTGNITLSGNADVLSDLYLKTITLGGANAQGDITLIADKYTLIDLTTQTANNILIKPRTASTTIGLMGGAGTLNLNSTYLGYFNPGNKLIIGDSTAGTGTVTIGAWDLSGKTYGVEVYGGTVDFTGAVQWNQANNLLFHSRTGDLAIDQAFTKSGGGTSALTFKAGNTITQTATIVSSSGALNTILWSDTDNSGAGAISIVNRNINSNGGDIIMGGGLDANADGRPDGEAQGTATNLHGIYIAQGILTSGAGNISLRGHGYDEAASGHYLGVYITTGTTISATSGNINLFGQGGTNGTGIYFAVSDMTTTTGNITFTGYGGGGSGVNNYGLEIGGLGSEVSSVDGNITLIGTGGGTGVSNTNVGVRLYYYPTISTTGNGNITVLGTGGNGAYRNTGVDIYDNAQLSVNQGNLSITGVAGHIGFENRGVSIGLNSILRSNGAGPSVGTITINGTGGNGTTHNQGVIMSNTSLITSVDGAISVTGTGGAASSNHNYGIYLLTGADITSTGTGTNAANITLTGTASGGTSSNHGIYMDGSGTTVNTTDGDLTLIGTGNGTTTDNRGIYLENGAQISSSGIGTSAGNITINGTGANGGSNNYGFFATGTSTMVSAVDGDITMTGQGGHGSGADNEGIYLANSAAIRTTGTGSSAGNITLTGTGGNGAGGNNDGFYSHLGGTVSTVDGSISITGYGGHAVGQYYAYGVNTGTITSTGTGNAGKTITITGYGGDARRYGTGINVVNVTSYQGAINITGYGNSNALEGFSNGVDIHHGTVRAYNNAVINITGTGGANGNGVGIWIPNGGIVQSDVGAIHLTGTGGNQSSGNYGIFFRNASGNFPNRILSNSGNITLQGIGGNNSSGVLLDLQYVANALTEIVSNTGNIFISGQSTSAWDLYVHTGLTPFAIGSGSATGNITFALDKWNLLNTSVQTQGNITVRPRTASTSIGLSGGAGTLAISGSVLDMLHAGNELLIGRSDGTGAMTLGAYSNWSAIAGQGVKLLSDSGSITISGAQNFGSRNLTIETNADPAIHAAMTGTGILIIQPTSVGTSMGLAGGTGTLNLSTSELNHIGSGWGSILLGRTDGTGAITQGAYAWSNPVTWRTGGTITVNGAQTAVSGSDTTFAFQGPTLLNAGLDLTGASGGSRNITFTNAVTILGTIASGGGSVAFNGSTNLGANVSTSGGNLSFAQPVILTNHVTLTAGAGTLRFNGSLDGGYNLAATTSDTLTVAGNIGQNTRLANLSLSGGTLSLPSSLILADSLSMSSNNGHLNLNTDVNTVSATLGGNLTLTNHRAVTLNAIQADGVSITTTSGSIVMAGLLTASTLNLDSAGAITDNNGNANNLLVNGSATLRANTHIGTLADPLEVQVTGALSVFALGKLGDVSVNINGSVLSGNTLARLNNPPGLVIFNGMTLYQGDYNDLALLAQWVSQPTLINPAMLNQMLSSSEGARGLDYRYIEPQGVLMHPHVEIRLLAKQPLSPNQMEVTDHPSIRFWLLNPYQDAQYAIPRQQAPILYPTITHRPQLPPVFLRDDAGVWSISAPPPEEPLYQSHNH